MLKDCLRGIIRALVQNHVRKFLIQRKLWALQQFPCLRIWGSHKGKLCSEEPQGCPQPFSVWSGMLSGVGEDSILPHVKTQLPPGATRFAAAGITSPFALTASLSPMSVQRRKAFVTEWPKLNCSDSQTNTTHYSVSTKLRHKYFNHQSPLAQVLTELIVGNQLLFNLKHPESIPQQIFLSAYQTDTGDWVENKIRFTYTEFSY